MIKYHKINSIFKRDQKGNFLIGEYSTPEFEYLKDIIWTFDEKVDGTNIRIGFNGESVEFGGRTDNAQIPAPLYKKLSELFTVENLKEVFPDLNEGTEVVLFGEGYGNKIQKVGKLYNPDGVDFILFDVNINGTYLLREDVEDIANKLKINFTPMFGEGTIQQAIDIVTKGVKSPLGEVTSEGFILRPKIPLLNRNGKRIITKIKHKDFNK